MNLKNNKNLYLITVLYLVLPFINIHFALLGIVCMAIPITLLLKTKSNIFCRHYCARSSMLNKLKFVKKNQKKRKIPKIIGSGKLREYTHIYFIISIIFMLVTTIMVVIGRNQAMEMIRLFILIPIGQPFQLLQIESTPWVIHLAYRMYSMILSTVVIGVVLGYLYAPRTWCAICPITTFTKEYQHHLSKKNK